MMDDVPIGANTHEAPTAPKNAPDRNVRVAPEEIRFAVVLNGGVSLAVWMGGAVYELDRLRRGLGPYGVLLKRLASSVRVDVIAGTSAGGINGAALALAQANERADLLVLRDLWADQGRMESLLREPFHASPTSLLKGDEYFLPELRRALDNLIQPFCPPKPGNWIDLTITTTLLRGARDVTVDALGQQLTQEVHKGRFHFQSIPTAESGPGCDADDFCKANIKRTVARLALAARTSAGFPFAFEPSFIPVRPASATEEIGKPATIRPDMTEVASWGQRRFHGSSADQSRFAVDGGLLANTPTREALRAIDRMPPLGPARRVMLLVFPHASADDQDLPDDEARMPTVAATFGGLVGALLGEGSRTFVNEVEEHNRVASSRRANRLDVLTSLDQNEPVKALYHLVEHLHPHYRTLRMRRAASYLADHAPPCDGWSYERIRTAAEEAQLYWQRTASPGDPPLPYVASVKDGRPDLGPSGWGWGTVAALDVAEAALDLFKRLIWVLPLPESSPDQGRKAVARLEEARMRTHVAKEDLRRIRREMDDVWEHTDGSDPPEPNESYWRKRLHAYEHNMLPGSDAPRPAPAGDPLAVLFAEATSNRRAHFGDQTRSCLLNIATEVAGVLELLSRAAEPEPEQRSELKPWQRLLAPGRVEPEPESQEEWVLSRLLALSIATHILGDWHVTEASFPVELVQLSLQTKSPFMAHTTTADDKVGGMSLARFSGFLKRSWRMNDWTWGRLDAATILCQILLDPARVRHLAGFHPGATLLCGGHDGEPPCVKARRRAFVLLESILRELQVTATAGIAGFDETKQEALKELADVLCESRKTGDLPNSLRNTAALVAWALHARIAAEELPVIARAVRADGLEGSNPRSRGELFLAENEPLIRELEARSAMTEPDRGPTTPPTAVEDPLALGVQALTALDRAGIGREPLSEEGTSDQMIRTVTTATGVAATVAAGEQLGLRLTKPISRTLRGLVILPYWVIMGLARGGPIVKYLSLLALAVGGTLVALALLGVLPGWAAGPGAALGMAALLAAFGYAAMRTGSVLHGIVLLTPLIPLVVYADTALPNPTPGDASAEPAVSSGNSVSVVVIISILVLGLIVLGSLPAPLGTPAATLGRLFSQDADLSDVASADRPAWSRRLRRIALATGRLLLLALGLSVATGVVWGTVELYTVAPTLVANARNFVAMAWPSVRESLESDSPGRLLVAAGGMAVFVAFVGFYLVRPGTSLRQWQLDHDGRWKRHRVTHPAGTSASWSVVYGLAYLAAATVLIAFAPEQMTHRWARTALTTAVVFATGLLLVAPWAIPFAARRRLSRRLVIGAEGATFGMGGSNGPLPNPETVRTHLSTHLEAKALTYHCLVRVKENCLVLTRRGRAAARRIRRRLLYAAGVPAWLMRYDLGEVKPSRPAFPSHLRAMPGASEQWTAGLRRVLAWSDGLTIGQTTVFGARLVREQKGDLVVDERGELAERGVTGRRIGRKGDLVIGRIARGEYAILRRGRVLRWPPRGLRRHKLARNVRVWIRLLIDRENRQRRTTAAHVRGSLLPRSLPQDQRGS